jgi:hypothetical protein
MATYTQIACIMITWCLVLYLLYRWYQKRIPPSREGLGVIEYPPQTAFVDSKNMPLKEYAIKSSFNSAYDGKKNTIDQLSAVMYHGCRFLDFNVFATDASKVVIGFSADNSPTLVDASLSLDMAIDYINTYAFKVDKQVESKLRQTDYRARISDAISPGRANRASIQTNYPNTPLFVNIRVYRPPSSDIDIVGLVNPYIEKLKNRYLDQDGNALPVTQYTPLADLANKVVVVMDIENILQIYTSPPPYDPLNIPPPVVDTLNKMANIRTGGQNWAAFYSYKDVNKSNYTMLKKMDDKVRSNTYETNAMNMQIVYPSYSEPSNPDSYLYMKNYSIQTIPHRYYVDDDNLAKYNKLFDSNATPFVPLYSVLTFTSKP